MTPARALLIAVVAVALLIGTRPMAGDEQFPRGLMSAAPRAPSRSCTIETRPLSFGVYDTLAETEVDAVAQIIYICSEGNGRGGGPPDGRGGGPPDGRGGGGGSGAQSIRIEIDQGGNQSFDPRGMIGLSLEVLDYNIYLDATRRTIWGTGVGGTQVYIDNHPPDGTPVTVPAFGRIFRRQDVPAGDYVDSVRVGIVF